MTQPRENQPMTYDSVGVVYDAMDPLKREAQLAASTTSRNLERRGFFTVEMSRGESAFVVDEGDRYSAHTLEALGTKALVEKELRAERIRNHVSIAESIEPSTGRTHFDTLAIDTIAMMVNDIVTVGADPLVINAYWSTGSADWFKDAERRGDLVNGWARGCNMSGATWGGGETPVNKGVTYPEEVDLAGSVYGIIKPKERLTLGDKLKAGDAIWIVGSSGIGANGLTLGRGVGEEIANERGISIGKAYETPLPDGQSYGEALLTPTHIYARLVQDLFEAGIDVHYMSNITGHGWRKIMRSTKELTYNIDRIPRPHPVFDFIKERSRNDDTEMYGTFNMGAGFAVFLPEEMVETAQKIAEENYGFDSTLAGRVEEGPRQVKIKPIDVTFGSNTLGVR